MRTVFDEESNTPVKGPGILPPPLAQLLTVTRTNTAEVMERLLLQAQTGEAPFEEMVGTEYLLFTCGGVECCVPLAALREVLPALPQVVPLPASPDWMLGIFALRTEMIALIDPVPMLLGRHDEHAHPHPAHPAVSQPAPAPHAFPYEQSQPAPDHLPAAALIVGTGERCLAWAIALVGDIVRLEDHEIVSSKGNVSASAGAVRERYSAGSYTRPQDGRCYTLLRTDLLLDDVLQALEEEPDGRA